MLTEDTQGILGKKERDVRSISGLDKEKTQPLRSKTDNNTEGLRPPAVPNIPMLTIRAAPHGVGLLACKCGKAEER